MRLHTSSALLAGAILLVSAFCVTAQPSWQFLGLKDRGINCLLADDTTMIIAGTDSGMSVYWNRAWYDFPLKQPVTSILRYSAREIFAGASSLKDTGAVFIGNNILFGPPFYSLRLQQPFIEPTAMAINNTMAIPRLYTGGHNVVAVGMLDIGKDSLQPFQPVKIPPYAFGVENPKCAALFMFSGATLYAGGYDRGLMGGPASLLQLSTDTLIVVRRLNVTALAQGTFGVVTQQQLVIGTRDTGVLLYEPVGRTWTAIASPANRLPITHLIAVSSGMIPGSLIIAAVDSGVYTINSPTGRWVEVGNLPAVPTCVAPRGDLTGASLNGALLTGTTQGVYLYGLPVGIREHASPADFVRQAQPIVCRNGEVRLLLPRGTSGITGVDVYTSSGRLCRHVAVSAQAVSFRLEAEGLYYYRCVSGNRTALSGKLVVMQ